jgi:hypothetical protein
VILFFLIGSIHPRLSRAPMPSFPAQHLSRPSNNRPSVQLIADSILYFVSDCLSPNPFKLNQKLRMNAELADLALRWPPLFCVRRRSHSAGSHTCCQMAPKEGPWQMDGSNKSGALFMNLFTQGGPEALLSPCQQHPSFRFRISCSSYCCPSDYSIS